MIKEAYPEHGSKRMIANMKAHRQPVTAATLALLVGFALGLINLGAGERVIFSNSNSKISVPKEGLKNTSINPTAQGFKKEHSSVDAVFAPWQNPMNSASSLKRRQQLLKALDRQKNWMLQDPEELLESTDLSAEADLDEFDAPSWRGRYQRSGRSTFERYYTKREEVTRVGRDRYDRTGSGFSDGEREPGDGFEETEDEDRQDDPFAKPKDFETQFESIFDQQPEFETATSVSSESIQEQVDFSRVEGQVDGVPSTFGDASPFPVASQGQATPQVRAEFESLLNTAFSTTQTETAPGGVSNFAASSPGVEFGFNAAGATGVNAGGLQSPVLNSFRSTLSEGLGTGSVLGEVSGAAGAAGGGGSALFNANPVTQSTMNRPAIFELPKRSF